MLKIGLTSSKYCNTDIVINKFKELGVPVFDADVIAKFLIHYDDDVIQETKNKFGADVWYNGVLQRMYFNSNDDIDKLIDIIFLKLIKSYERFRLKHINDNYVIFKSSFLFERMIDKSMNVNILVFANKDKRIQNGIQEKNSTFLEIFDELSGEYKDTDKSKNSNFIIYRDANLGTSLDNQIMSIHRLINNKCKKSASSTGELTSLL